MNKSPYWDQHKPDKIDELQVDGYKVVSYTFGSGNEVVLCLNGGPGAACDYIRDSHSFLSDFNFRVIAFDQLGTGNSDRPDNDSLWTIERYVEEVESVRSQLDLGKVHLLGQSWGGWLAIEYCTKYIDNVKTLVLENTCADIPHLRSELTKLRKTLGPEIFQMMKEHEDKKNYNHPEYEAAITLLQYRHMLRLKELPEPVKRTFDTFNKTPYEIMQGPNEFLYIGNLKDWSRLDDIKSFNIPTLITVGKFDEITPECSKLMHERLPDSEMVIFENSSHQPFFEEPKLFQETLVSFLQKNTQI